MQNHFEFGPVVSKDISIFSSGCRIICAILEEGILGNIPVKLFLI